MNKITRLALANMRRHRTETVLLAVLVMLCMTLLAGAVSAEKRIKSMFSDLMTRRQTWENRLGCPSKSYDAQMENILLADDRVTDSAVYEYLYSYDTRTLDENGKEKPFYTYFFTAENERTLENYAPETPFSEAEIAAMAHPIFVPQSQQKKLSLKAGDTFPIIRGSKKYTFTVAGFYESGCWEGAKFIVNDADYAVLKNICDYWKEIGFTLTEGSDPQAVVDDWAARCADAGINADTRVLFPLSEMRANFNLETGYILKIIEIMALIILIAVAVMIGYRIVSDIQDQIVSIGVLEALGYRSREIACAYALEYFLIALTGCVAGCLGSIGLNALLIHIAENMKGYPASHALSVPIIAAVFFGLLLLISLLAYRKARAVRKYPPVLAFRKGIGNHHFGKSHFPLEKTRSNVHLRLALKGFADHAKQNGGLTFVMSITTFAVVLSFILYSFLGKGTNVVSTLAGHELSMLVDVMPGIDCSAFAEELETIPEIRKALPSCDIAAYSLTAPGLNEEFYADVYRDYSETENIHVIEGRFPQHDNEVMITKQTSARFRLHVGDSIRLKYDSIAQDYLITGTVTALVNSENVFLTEDGMQRIYPTYRPTSVLIYPGEGVDHDVLRAELDRRYGKSAESLSSSKENTAENSSYEARVRAKAEQVMAAMLEQSGATHIEYAIQSGDTVISGSSSGIMIRSFLNLSELIEESMRDLCDAVSTMTMVFMAIAAAVVMMILSILMESEVRRQRRELGIMKGMGYTSKELMLQLSFRIMPAAFLATVIGTVLGVGATKLLVSFVGIVPVNIPAVLVLDLAILAFCFGCAWLGARKIKKISVYELMTE